MHGDYSGWIKTCSCIKWYCFWNRFVLNRCVLFLLCDINLNNGIFCVQFFKINLWNDYCGLGYVFNGWWLSWKFLDFLLTWNLSWLYTYKNVDSEAECMWMEGMSLYIYIRCGILGVLKLVIHQHMYYLLNLEGFNFTLKFT